MNFDIEIDGSMEKVWAPCQPISDPDPRFELIDLKKSLYLLKYSILLKNENIHMLRIFCHRGFLEFYQFLSVS